MIRLEVDENNHHVLRVTASYFLALAGDISATITDEATSKVVATGGIPDAVGEANFAKAHPLLAPAPDPHDSIEFHSPDAAPSPAEVFADPKPAPASAAAEALPTAPAVTEAPTSPPPSIPAPPPPAPQPEVAAAAPTVPAAPLNPAPAVELDADGLPWDARIHSEARSKVVAGTWKYKRGVDPRLVEEVEVELRAVMGLPAPSVAAPAAPAAVSATPLAPPAAPAGAPAPSGPTFPSLMLKISKAVAESRTTQVAIVETVKACGLENLPALAHRPDLVAGVDAAIDALLQGVAQ